MAAVLMAEALNKAQSEDVFRVIVVNGNGGDAADSYAIERAKAGEDVLLWHSITSYTVNHKEGLLPLAGMRKVSFSIMVNPDSNINSVSDIVTKGKLFVAVSSGNAFGLLLLSSFEKKYHLDITRLSYKSATEAGRAVLIGEADFTIFLKEDQPNLRALEYEFPLTTMTVVSVPIERAAYGEHIMPYINDICNQKEYQYKVTLDRFPMNCQSGDYVKNRVIQDIQEIQR
jgi:hypothetical protein